MSEFKPEQDPESGDVNLMVRTVFIKIIVIHFPEIVQERSQDNPVPEVHHEFLSRNVISKVIVVPTDIGIEFITEVDHQSVDRINGDQGAEFLTHEVIPEFVITLSGIWGYF